MSSLQTLDGISTAREELYNKLERGEIVEARALAQERVLRGQVELKATIPLRLLSIIAKAKNPQVQRYGGPLLKSVLRFTTGEELPAIEDASSSQDREEI